ncbi:MAG TPA: AAA family ATPase, partial [Pirellulales bacterium]|nr:AAA family ATPase [Pirellulales bacterium]
LIVVAGAKGGAGTTTIAVNLAVALAGKGRRTVVVDGDLGKGDVAAGCGLHGGPTIVDVLAGRRRVAEALRPGPAGLRIVPGAWATGRLTDCDASAQERLIYELRGLDGVDTVVIDAGCGMHRILERFWRAADQILLVTTTDDTSVMDAYAAVKTMSRRNCGVPVYAVVNQAARREQARQAHARLAQACRRFLAMDVSCAAHLMASGEIAAAARRQTPFLLTAPVCQAAQTIKRLAEFLSPTTTNARSHPKGDKNSQRTIQALTVGRPIIRAGVGRLPAGKL